MAGIKKCVLTNRFANGTRIVILEFPEIGHSLPGIISGDYLRQLYITAIYDIGAITGDSRQLEVNILEYGAQPDPDYFNITGVDVFGNPVYRGGGADSGAPEYTEREGE